MYLEYTGFTSVKRDIKFRAVNYHTFLLTLNGILFLLLLCSAVIKYFKLMKTVIFKFIGILLLICSLFSIISKISD